MPEMLDIASNANEYRWQMAKAIYIAINADGSPIIDQSTGKAQRVSKPVGYTLPKLDRYTETDNGTRSYEYAYRSNGENRHVLPTNNPNVVAVVELATDRDGVKLRFGNGRVIPQWQRFDYDKPPPNVCGTERHGIHAKGEDVWFGRGSTYVHESQPYAADPKATRQEMGRHLHRNNKPDPTIREVVDSAVTDYGHELELSHSDTDEFGNRLRSAGRPSLGVWHHAAPISGTGEMIVDPAYPTDNQIGDFVGIIGFDSRPSVLTPSPMIEVDLASAYATDKAGNVKPEPKTMFDKKLTQSGFSEVPVNIETSPSLRHVKKAKRAKPVPGGGSVRNDPTLSRLPRMSVASTGKKRSNRPTRDSASIAKEWSDRTQILDDLSDDNHHTLTAWQAFWYQNFESQTCNRGRKTKIDYTATLPTMVGGAHPTVPLGVIMFLYGLLEPSTYELNADGTVPKPRDHKRGGGRPRKPDDEMSDAAKRKREQRERDKSNILQSL